MPEKITLRVEKWVNDGFTLGFYDKSPVFVLGAIPGETVVCDLFEVTSKYSKGSVYKVIDPSPLRREAPCDIYLECGGCTFQHLDYTEEKIIKENLLKNDIIFNKLVDINSSILNSIPYIFEDEYGYRNNVQVKNKNGMNGFYKVKSNQLIPFPESGCLLLDKELNQYIKNFSNKIPMDGKIRKDSKGLKKYGSEISVFQIKDVTYEIPENGFFQINQFLVEAWLEKIKSLSGLDNQILEFFCGAGVISCFLSQNHSQIHGYELSHQSIQYAKHNAKKNSLSNLTFEKKDLYREDIHFTSKTDFICIANPPRAGLGKIVKKFIKISKPKKIIYSSCNYTTLIPDLKDLIGLYEIQSIEIFDFFPKTPYFETLVVLDKKNLANSTQPSN
jgi:23S rRNA (uracil1939-C5)-methyltransferase